MTDEQKAMEAPTVEAASAPAQVPLTKEQQLLNSFNACLNLVVREINILYGNVQGILNPPPAPPQQ